MKNRILIITLVLFLLSSTLFSCTKAYDEIDVSNTSIVIRKDNDSFVKKKYTVQDDGIKIYRCGTSSEASESSAIPTYDRWNTSFEATKFIESEKSFSINGRQVSGVYLKTTIEMPNRYETHKYIDQNGNTLCVDSVSGNLVEYSAWYEDFSAKDKEISETDAVQIAKKFLSEHNPSIKLDDYTVSSKLDESTNTYTVSFNKNIGGWAVADKASLRITKYGDVWYYSSSMLGEIQEDKSIEELDKQKIQEEFLNAVKESRKEADATLAEVEYICDDGSITISEDNEIMVIYLLQINERRNLGDGLYTTVNISDFYVVKV